MRRTVGVFLLVPTLACSAVSGLDDFMVIGGSGNVGGAGADAGAGGSGASGGGGAAGGRGGMGGARCEDGELLLDTFTNVREVTELNTADDEDDPTFTADGLLLAYNSAISGAGDVMQATRSDIMDPWGTPTVLPVVSTSDNESNPVLSPDGLTIWFNRNPGNQMYVSTRQSRAEDFSGPVPVDFSIQAGVGAVTLDLRTMVLHSNALQSQTHLYESRRASAADPWGMLTEIAELGPGQEAWLSPCGHHIYFGQAGDVVRATRPDLDSAFATPTSVMEISTTGNTGDPWLSADQRYMMFALGSNPRDLYEARR